jgi:hypothetical protein
MDLCAFLAAEPVTRFGTKIVPNRAEGENLFCSELWRRDTSFLYHSTNATAVSGEELPNAVV